MSPRLSPLLLLAGLSLGACASDAPAPDPRPEPAPVATVERPAPEPPLEIETELDSSFLLGFWAPVPDAEAIDDKIDILVEGGMEEQNAITACYQARLEFRADGSCLFGIGINGKIEGVETMEWSAEQRGAEELLVQMIPSDGSSLPALTVTRQQDLIDMSGDPVLDGGWVRLSRGNQAMAEDALTAQLARQHVNLRQKLADAAAELDAAMAQREESFATLVQSVKTVCRSEELTNDLDRKQPLRGKDIIALRESLQAQEGVLMALPLDDAPKSPVMSQHQGKAEVFDEHWLTGTWGFDFSQIDPELFKMAQADEEMQAEIQAILETRRRSFTIRGEFHDRMGAPEIVEEAKGYYCVTPGAGPWVWVTFLKQIGGAEVGMESEDIRTFAAYRIGSTLWIEEGPGVLVPLIRKGA